MSQLAVKLQGFGNGSPVGKDMTQSRLQSLEDDMRLLKNLIEQNNAVLREIMDAVNKEKANGVN